MGGQSLDFTIETARHPYNNAALPRSLWYVFAERDAMCIIAELVVISDCWLMVVMQLTLTWSLASMIMYMYFIGS